ncbi:protein-lysine N-methyltransferase EFM3 isoform X1 [Sesamum indicum]|uniref:Protein-lysine N-methyltransferase EFM3 isoform X1 n=1 Tax=Sesamum indicum TaxID=4182 RepID=A0A6I9TTP8_SESIN|nr:protein-lysine N-methyltransferase EFM3 isoform X1 [Sesamum indicum]
MERDGVEDDDIVCLDESFFINDNYQLTRFTFGSQVLELYCLQSASTDFDLTGQLVWPGAELLNHYLSKNADMLRGCSVIELGSGVGITGILCSRFCSEVVMTDHNDEVLKILTRNIELHQSSQDSHSCARLKAEKLEWGNSEQLKYILQRHPEGFDLVLGADICFQQSSIPLLFNTVEKLLQVSRQAKCKFILGYVSRAKVMDDMVISEASQHGLHVTEVAGTRATVRNLEGVIYEITCG